MFKFKFITSSTYSLPNANWNLSSHLYEKSTRTWTFEGRETLFVATYGTAHKQEMLFTLICASHSGSFPFVMSYPFHSSHFRRVTTYQRLLQFPQTKQIRRSNPLALPRVSNLVWPKTLSTKTEKAGENPQQRQLTHNRGSVEQRDNHGGCRQCGCPFTCS